MIHLLKRRFICLLFGVVVVVLFRVRLRLLARCHDFPTLTPKPWPLVYIFCSRRLAQKNYQQWYCLPPPPIPLHKPHCGSVVFILPSAAFPCRRRSELFSLSFRLSRRTPGGPPTRTPSPALGDCGGGCRSRGNSLQPHIPAGFTTASHTRVFITVSHPGRRNPRFGSNSTSLRLTTNRCTLTMDKGCPR